MNTGVAKQEDSTLRG